MLGWPKFFLFVVAELVFNCGCFQGSQEEEVVVAFVRRQWGMRGSASAQATPSPKNGNEYVVKNRQTSTPLPLFLCVYILYARACLLASQVYLQSGSTVARRRGRRKRTTKSQVLAVTMGYIRRQAFLI